MPIALISVVLFLVLWNRPDSIFVNRGISDYEGEYFLAQDDWQRSEENSLFVGDMSSGQKIYEFTGNIVTMEWIRGLVSSLVWGEIGGMFFVMMAENGQKFRKKKR